MRLIDVNELKAKFHEYCNELFEIEDIEKVIDLTKPVETTQQWVSVKDRLPERYKTSYPRGNNPDFSNVSEPVWIFTQNGYMTEGTLEGDSWFDEMGQCLSDYFEDMSGHHVTHWMPLPEPPKEEEK
jgi:hypothetical protein